jgi:hypothetical protein
MLKNKKYGGDFVTYGINIIPFQQLKTSCNEDYVNVDPSNTACVMALAYYEKVRLR